MSGNVIDLCRANDLREDGEPKHIKRYRRYISNVIQDKISMLIHSRLRVEATISDASVTGPVLDSRGDDEGSQRSGGGVLVSRAIGCYRTWWTTLRSC